MVERGGHGCTAAAEDSRQVPEEDGWVGVVLIDRVPPIPAPRAAHPARDERRLAVAGRSFDGDEWCPRRRTQTVERRLPLDHGGVEERRSELRLEQGKPRRSRCAIRPQVGHRSFSSLATSPSVDARPIASARDETPSLRYTEIACVLTVFRET